MDRSWMYTKRRHATSYLQDVNGFIEAAKRHALIKKTKDIYCPYFDCQNRIVCRDPNTRSPYPRSPDSHHRLSGVAII